MRIGKKLKIFKTLIFSIIILTVAISSLINVTGQSTSSFEINYTFEKPVFSTVQINNDIYDKITIDNSYIAGNPGEPTIPSKGVYILLPQNTKPKDIKVIAYEKINLGNNYNIQPLGEVLPILETSTISELKKDKNIYETNDFYPGNLYSKVGVYSLKGYDILVLLLNPVQYNPVTGEIVYYKNIKVTIETAYKENNQLFRGLEKDRNEVITKVDNPEFVSNYIVNQNLNPASFDSYDLLILTTDALKTAFEPLKIAHDSKGLPTVIKTLTDVGSSDPEDIRDYITDAYLNWGTDYVLLGGDQNIVPYRTLWVYGLDEGTDPYDTYMPSDIYYSCLDGPYNYDGDDKWGEPTDGEGGADVDLMSEVHVGRACVDNTNDVNNFVTKTVAYINKDPSLTYLSNACFAGEYMGDYGIATWGGNYMDQLIDSCSDDGYTTVGIPSSNYTVITLYDRDDPWEYYDMMNTIDGGIHFINHLGHSSYDYNMKMENDDIYDLSNDDFCFIYSQGCMAGGFDDPWGYDCFAEVMTVKTNSGAFAGIWNARYGWFWSYSTDGDSQRLHRQFWNAVFGQNIPQIGKANSYSKEANLPIIGRSCIRWCCYETNLFGDPSLSFFETQQENTPPETPEISGPAIGNPGINYEYEFLIYDADSDDLWLRIDWGDGKSEDWLGPLGNGAYTAEHTWEEQGAFTIKAKVKDSFEESDWGTLDIQIPRNRNYINLIFFKLLERFPRLLQILQNLKI